ATLFLYNIERELGRSDVRFLERSFQGLMQNFNWWVNRRDPQGKNVFAGGFLGLDNIGVFDRSAQLPTGGHLDQADGTAWMAFYCQNMLEIALILAEHDSGYEEIAYRFLQHFAPADSEFIGYAGRRLLSVCNQEKIERILAYMLDENEFLGPCGIRSLSRYHQEHPFIFNLNGQEFKVQYLPAESNTGMFGGNSNWRGPVWMPVNGLLIRGLLNLYQFYGDDFKVECPTGSGKYMTLFEVAKELARRLSSIFLRDANGRRPVYGGTKKFQEDQHWKNYILFYEYFHGDNGAGLGASHQTGWTGIIARSLDLFARLKPADALKTGKADLVARMTREQVAG